MQSIKYSRPIGLGKIQHFGGSMHSAALRYGAETSPKIPGGDAAEGSPRLRQLGQPIPIWKLAQLVLLLDADAQAEIRDGEDVRPAQRKNQEHLSGPRPDPTNRQQTIDDLLVGELIKIVQRQFASVNLVGQIA